MDVSMIKFLEVFADLIVGYFWRLLSLPKQPLRCQSGGSSGRTSVSRYDAINSFAVLLLCSLTRR